MNALKSVRFVFARLEHDSFAIFNDLHMKHIVLSFKRSEIEFVDMGACLLNEVKNEKFYFIKMVHCNEVLGRRDVYILAFAEGQINKWDNSLRLKSRPVFIDPALESLHFSLR